MTFNWNQAKAAGKHVASYAAGGVTMAVALHFLSPSQGTDVAGNINAIVNGVEQVATGIGGLIAIATPFYTAWRASHNASPAAQGAALVAVANNSTNPAAAKVANAAIASAVIEANDLKLNGTIAAPAGSRRSGS